MEQQQQLQCKRNGCKKKYYETENEENICKHHPGKPIFHDLKKGWTCCNKIVYDWDEFEKLPTCAEAKHVDKLEIEGSEFYKSNTVSNAQKAIDKEESNIKVHSIDEYNKQQEEIKRKQEELNANKEKKPFITKEGQYKCVNKGCLKPYNQDQNNEGDCKYHPGDPIFRDTVKYWTCCKKEVWDWDDFIKLPTCSEGKHVPKMV